MSQAGTQERRRIAIVGGGIAGLGAAYFLSPRHDVTVFEAEPRLGGHARTIWVGPNKDQPVDTGFIIFNRPNYPHLWRLFDELQIPRTKSEMSFSVSLDDRRFEYALKPKGALGGILAQPRNMLDPRFRQMFRDILRFNARALDEATDPAQTLDAFLSRLGTGDWFRDRFLLPLTGAIWSVPARQALEFPAQSLIRFLGNHALLGHRGHHQWYTVDGGAALYVQRLAQMLSDRGVTLHTGSPVQCIDRSTGKIRLRADGDWDTFDEVVLALHADQVLPLLTQPSPEERQALADIRFQPNPAVLHSDPGVMPLRRSAWASWNFQGALSPQDGTISATYCMNKLQTRIPKTTPLFVSLNPSHLINPALVHDRVTFRHPIFDFAGQQARQVLAATNGRNQTWYCGAWMQNGFHEDGLASAAEVASQLNARLDAMQRAG
jgi:predicted NAD/FAD-binding protein